jgi:hypothetical protein
MAKLETLLAERTLTEPAQPQVMPIPRESFPLRVVSVPRAT